MGLLTRLKRLPGQILGRNPFKGSLRVERLPVLWTALTTFRHFRTPLKILDYVFQGDADVKYLDVPGFPPFLFVRDPELIRTITVETANQGNFDRDTLPTQGIARVVGGSNLLFAQGETWRRHRAAAARPFGATAVLAPDVYREMETAVRRAVEPRLDEIAERVRQSPTKTYRMRLESDVKAVMLDVLVNVLFGSAVPHDELKTKYLPAIENVIRYIMVDTLANPFRIPVFRLPALTRRHAQLKQDRQVFEELVDRVIRTRSEGAGFWRCSRRCPQRPSTATSGYSRRALEATTSYIKQALVNLARHPAVRAKAYAKPMPTRRSVPGARQCRLPAEGLDGELRPQQRPLLPARLRPPHSLDVKGRSRFLRTPISFSQPTTPTGARNTGGGGDGYPATAFVPERWDAVHMEACGRSPKDNLHFGFGHGSRVCIGKHFSEAEAFVCLTLFLRRFEFTATGSAVEADSGVSTRPADKVDLELSLRFFGRAPAAPGVRSTHTNGDTGTAVAPNSPLKSTGPA